MSKVFNDWRVPTIEELLTLVNYEKHCPACDLEDTESSAYWSATTYLNDTNFAWCVGFYSGFSTTCLKGNSKYVRCVRDGENVLEWSVSSKKEMTLKHALEYAKNLEAEVYPKAGQEQGEKFCNLTLI